MRLLNISILIYSYFVLDLTLYSCKNKKLFSETVTASPFNFCIREWN